MSQDMNRTKMTDEQAEKFLTKYVTDRGLSTQAANKHIRLVAAKRLAALDRYTTQAGDRAADKATSKGSAKKGAKKGTVKAPAKKASKPASPASSA